MTLEIRNERDDLRMRVRELEWQVERLTEALNKCWRFIDKGNATEFYSQCGVCGVTNVQVPTYKPMVHKANCWFAAALKQPQEPV